MWSAVDRNVVMWRITVLTASYPRRAQFSFVFSRLFLVCKIMKCPVSLHFCIYLDSIHSLRIATAVRRLMWLWFPFITEKRRGEHISFVLLSEPWSWSCCCIGYETAVQLPSVVMTLVIYSYILTRQFIVRFLYTEQSLATFFLLDILVVRWPIFPSVL